MSISRGVLVELEFKSFDDSVPKSLWFFINDKHRDCYIFLIFSCHCCHYFGLIDIIQYYLVSIHLFIDSLNIYTYKYDHL